MKKRRERKNVRRDLINHYRIPFNLENNNPKKREREGKGKKYWTGTKNVDFLSRYFNCQPRERESERVQREDNKAEPEAVVAVATALCG